MQPTPPTLFRPQVLAERRAQWLGPVLLTPRASHRLFTLVGVLTAAAITALLVLGDFTRTARINGWLVPQEGVVRVFAPRPGVVTALHVAEGSSIRKGEPLLTLSDEVRSSALGATQAEIARRLEEQSASLAEDRQQKGRLLVQQQRALAARIDTLHAEEEQIDREIDLMKARVTISQRAEDLHRQLHEKGYVSEQRLQTVMAERLEQMGRLEALRRSRLTLARERMGVAAELKDLPLNAGKELSAIERAIAQLEQSRAEAEARREIVVLAPQDGTVTAIHAVAGARAETTVPLLSLVPVDARLEAHLYSPSRAVGFVRPGQSVLLRYEAFPYQRFGQYEGVVTSVSRSAVSPAELPPQLAGLTSLTAAGAAGSAVEPVYRVTVKPASQAVSAYGSHIALQPGMLLQADVALERRRLYEWVLDPLYAAAGKWRG